jgi:hypothetical protein
LDVTVTFDASGLSEGDYEGKIWIESNDPDESPFAVPVELTVLENPGIEVTIYADYLGYDYPNGQDGDSLNAAPITIDDVADTTPVYLSVPKCTTFTLGVPNRASLERDGFWFGSGPYDHWSDGGEQAHTVTLLSDTTLTVYFDPDLLSTRGCSDFAGVINDWADTGDTVLVHPGEHEINETTGDPVAVLRRTMTVLSEEGSDSTTIEYRGANEPLRCRGASGFRIGAEDKGFTFDILIDNDACIDAKNCEDFVIEGNVFYGSELSQFQDNCCVQIRQCRDVLIEGNEFLEGEFGVYGNKDTTVTIAWNTFKTSGLYHLSRGIRVSNSRAIGIYGNYIEVDNRGVKGISSEGMRLGGSLDSGNVFVDCLKSFEYSGTAPNKPRVEAECNYWGSMDWDEICDQVLDSPDDRVDFIPWADSALTQKYVPFDPDSCEVAAPGSVAVCPAGDFGELEVTLTVRDSSGGAIVSMWCDDVEILWSGSEYGELYPCRGADLFDSEQTDSSGEATVDWSEMGGCGSMRFASIEGVALSETTEVLVNSPDMDGDGDVDSTDYYEFEEIYLTTEICGDYNYNGTVDLADFTDLGTHFDDTCPVGFWGGYPGDVVSSGHERSLPEEEGVSLEKPLLEAAPNPSSGVMQLRFGAPVAVGSRLGVELYDVRGRHVGTIYRGSNEGAVEMVEIGRGIVEMPRTGVYFVRFEVDGHVVKTQKIILLK